MPGKIDHVIVFVHDLDRAKTFYQELLGLPLLREIPGFITFDLGSIWLGLHESESEGEDIGSGPLIYLSVENLDLEIAELKAKGVQVKREALSVPGGMIAIIEDSEGNSLGMYQSVQA